MRLLLIAQIAAVLVIVACDSNEDSPADATATPAETATVAGGATFTPQPQLPVIDLDYGDGILRVEIASTAEQRSRGLSGRPSLGADEGMLFDLGSTRVPSFSMRGMLFALDFIWITEDQRVQGITAGVQPQQGADSGDLDSYSPTAPVRYVLEINAGAAGQLGIEEGDALAFDLP